MDVSKLRGPDPENWSGKQALPVGPERSSHLEEKILGDGQVSEVPSLQRHKITANSKDPLPALNSLHTPLFLCTTVTPDHEFGGCIITYKPRPEIDAKLHSAEEIAEVVKTKNADLYPAVEPGPESFTFISIDAVRSLKADSLRTARTQIRAFNLGSTLDSHKRELQVNATVGRFEREFVVAASDDGAKYKIGLTAAEEREDDWVETPGGFLDDVLEDVARMFTPRLNLDYSDIKDLLSKLDAITSREWASQQEATAAISEFKEQLGQELRTIFGFREIDAQIRKLLADNPDVNSLRSTTKNALIALMHRHSGELKNGTLSDAFSNELDRLLTDDVNTAFREYEDECSFFNDLGYSYSGGVLSVPDKVSLQGRWDRKRAEDPTLPELRLAVSAGIAGDLPFAYMLTKVDALKSIGGETLHDEFLHVIPTLRAMRRWKNTTYSTRHREIFRVVIDAHTKLSNAKVDPQEEQDLKILQTLLGAFVDTMTNQVNSWETMVAALRAIEQLGRDPFLAFTMPLLKEPQWKGYLERRYGQGALDEDRLRSLWIRA